MSVKHLLKKFTLPSRIEKIEETKDGNESVITLQTFERGFATTLGNSLRRTLLSSMQSFSVTGVRVTVFDEKGGQRFITSEFDTIPGIVEDTVDVFDAIKDIKFIVADQDIDQFTVDKLLKGSEKLTLSVFEIEGVSILNKDKVLMTPTENIDLHIELQVELGRGYVPAEVNEKSITEAGVVALDSLFSPIVNVVFNVENVRVGHRNDFEKLVLRVETDGTISAIDAIAQSAKILKDSFLPLINFEESLVKIEEVVEKIDDKSEKKLNTSIEDLELSQRSSNCFKNANILFVRDLVKLTEREVENLPNFGKKCMDEVKDRLKELELYFGMEVE